MCDNLISNIGLEVHAELSTDTKIFCSCKNEFGANPNTNVCPVCLGLPGALPTLNEKALQYAIKMGLALNCSINSRSEMARKNYFYPDLPKGYQISQAEKPICENGYLDFLSDGKVKRVNIERIHIEEDAGKLIHSEGKNQNTLIDYNRCGVPLIEIVTRPDIESPRQAKDFLETIKSILSYLDICDCKMQEGSIRCDVNVSVHKDGEPLGTRVEMKNVNSFSGVFSAIEFEQNRQFEILKAGGTISQETRRWNDAHGSSEVLRTKENANDYRYFPEPDIPPILLNDDYLNSITIDKSALPNLKAIDYYLNLGLSQTDAVFIASDNELKCFFDLCNGIKQDYSNSTAKWIMTDILKHLNKNRLALSQTALTPEYLIELISLIEEGTVSSTGARKIFEAIISDDSLSPHELAEKLGLIQISDNSFLESLADDVIEKNEKSVADYKNGKDNALGFLIGQCMKKSKGRANPALISNILISKLNK